MFYLVEWSPITNIISFGMNEVFLILIVILILATCTKEFNHKLCKKRCAVLSGPPPLRPSLTSLLLSPLLHFLALHSLLCNLALVYSWGGRAEYRLTVRGLMACYRCLETAVRRRRRSEAGRRGTGGTEVSFVLFFQRGDSWSGIGSEAMKKEPLNRS